MSELVQFHQRGGLWYAFLGVHRVAAARDSGEWMSMLDGDGGWRHRAGLDAAKAAIAEHVRQWYEAAHQKLAPGQAERLCKMPAVRTKEVVKINAIDLEAVALRIKRDGVVTTYVMPAVAFDADGAPQATLAQARMYCISAQETAAAKSRSQPADLLAAHECAVFAGMVRLIDACASSPVIGDELRRIARERRLESTRDENDLTGEAEGAVPA